MTLLSEVAVVCRSKNAGPFLLTLDVVLPDARTYEAIRRTGALSQEVVSQLYGVPKDKVQFTEFPLGNAFKATLPRLVGSGDAHDSDVYGAQQHAPLMDIEVPGL